MLTLHESEFPTTGERLTCPRFFLVVLTVPANNERTVREYLEIRWVVFCGFLYRFVHLHIWLHDFLYLFVFLVGINGSYMGNFRQVSSTALTQVEANLLESLGMEIIYIHT